MQTPDSAIRIPINPQIRSFNLSNSVAIVLYEALRQNDFFSMQTEGNLHRLSWENPDIVLNYEVIIYFYGKDLTFFQIDIEKRAGT